MTPMLAEHTAVAHKPIDQVDIATLSPVVSQALGTQVTVIDWHSKPLAFLDHSTQVTSGGIYRLDGTAVDGDQRLRDWSLVVKIFKSPAGAIMPDGTQLTREMAEDEAGFGYWRREIMAAQSSLLKELPPGLTTPRYYHTTDMGDTAWLWQSEVVDAQRWDWAQYWEAAYRLGTWQGQYVSGKRPLPDLPWLSRDWLRGWVDRPMKGLMQIMEKIGGWQHPLLGAYLAPDELEQLQELWARREEIFASLARLPRTLAHLDAYRANLFWQGDTLAMIDWAFVGVAPLGEEMAAFVGATLLLNHVPLAEAEKLEATALNGYLAGLRAAGWHGDAEQVWSAYRYAMPLRYAHMSLGSMLRTELQPGFAEQWQQQEERPLADILQHRAGFTRFMLDRVWKG